MAAGPTRIISYAEVLDRVGLARTQVARLVKSGDFPTPVELDGRRVGFVEHEVESWIEARIAHRDTPEARARREARSEHFSGLVSRRWHDRAQGEG